MATYYVTTSGSDSNNGLTEGTAFASPGYAASQATSSGDIVYVKYGTYTITTSTQNVSGGTVLMTDKVRWEGYENTVGDLGSKPTINGGPVTATSIVQVPATGRGSGAQATTLTNFILDGASGTYTYGVYQPSAYVFSAFRVDATNVARGFNGYIANYYECKATNCSTYGFQGAIRCIDCVAENCTSTGYYKSNTIRCLANGCGIGYRGESTQHMACIAYNNTTQGFYFPSNREYGQLENCIAVNNGTYGFENWNCPVVRCAAYNNATANFRSPSSSATGRFFYEITLTADPFTSASTGDFSLNSDPGGGELLKSYQHKNPIGTDIYPDIGILQREVTAGGGNVIVIEE